MLSVCNAKLMGLKIARPYETRESKVLRSGPIALLSDLNHLKSGEQNPKDSLSSILQLLDMKQP